MPPSKFLFDPLKIHYLLILPEEAPEDASPFQGFSRGWRDINWALGALSSLPADVLEGEAPLDPLISQRMGGGRALSWSPLWITAFEQLVASDLGLFVVLFSGNAEIARHVEQWRSVQEIEVLHISTADGFGALDPGELVTERVIFHCQAVLAAHGSRLDAARREAAKRALTSWKQREPEAVSLEGWGYNVVTPNQMSLIRSNRVLEDGERFMGKNEEEYDKIILESTRAVFEVREQAGIRPFHGMFLIHPEVYLVEPALFRHAYRRVGSKRFSDPAVERILRLFQIQTGFLAQATVELPKALETSPLASTLMATRMSELRTFTLGVGLTAAQTSSAVLRMSPGVNRVFPALSAFARSVRSEKYEHRHKSFRLFSNIQTQLCEAVGKDKMAFIQEEVSGPIKIVADAPIEWLPIGPLPLLIRHQCSRINATPGNLLMSLLAKQDVVTVPPEVLLRVLVLSAFAPTDRLRNVLSGVLEAQRSDWDGKVSIVFRQVQTVVEFQEALNVFDGTILIFDGHGVGDSADRIGKLIIGNEQVNVWNLRQKIRVPPIVILSACDTHGLDSPSHATVGNGFLFLGAVTVVASLLPLGGRSSAAFVARLVYRLAKFIPSVLAAEKRVLNWTEIIWGMQRMFLASEILNELVGPPDVKGSPRHTIQFQANIDINTYEDEWFENLLTRIAEYRSEEYDIVARRAARVIALSEAVRYIQLGHPENILVDDGSIRAQFIPPHLLNDGDAMS